MVWKLSNDLLERIYVDDLRHGEMPNSSDYARADHTPIKEITKINTGVRAGKYDCKYDFNVSYYDVGCWGHASNRNKVGAWIVLSSREFFNDGPTKQDLNAASGINHIHFGMNHYGGSPTHVKRDEAWQKMYGPFLLYCNYNSAGADACWEDAKAQSQKELAAWPYSWLKNNPAYPLEAGRGRVSGKFVVHDPLKPRVTGAKAWIGLAQPEPGGNWQFESAHYQFWIKTDADGKFIIPHVRPGKYTLYAFTDGEVGEFSKTNVIVSAGLTNALGDVRWNIIHKGSRIAWEIGIPDRSAGEFRHGKDYFQGYLWQKIPDEFPNPLQYTVGKSDWSKDWNYAQTRYMKNGTESPHRWQIHFKLDRALFGSATLTLAIASAQRAKSKSS